MKYLRKRKVVKKDYKINKKVLLWTVFFIFIVMQVFFTVQSSTSGAKLTVLEEREKELAKENNALSRRLVETTAIRNIKNRAYSLGFSKPQQIIYISPEDAVAKLP